MSGEFQSASPNLPSEAVQTKSYHPTCCSQANTSETSEPSTRMDQAFIKVLLIKLQRHPDIFLHPDALFQTVLGLKASLSHITSLLWMDFVSMAPLLHVQVDSSFLPLCLGGYSRVDTGFPCQHRLISHFFPTKTIPLKLDLSHMNVRIDHRSRLKSKPSLSRPRKARATPGRWGGMESPRCHCPECLEKERGCCLI